jgi:hypothetical protein
MTANVAISKCDALLGHKAEDGKQTPKRTQHNTTSHHKRYRPKKCGRIVGCAHFCFDDLLDHTRSAVRRFACKEMYQGLDTHIERERESVRERELKERESD